MPDSTRVLLKLRPTSALAAASPKANLRPLYEGILPPPTLGVAAAPAWFLADLPDGGPTPWDAAHAQVAAQLGIAAQDILFVEPDVAHTIYRDVEEREGDQPLALDGDCSQAREQSSKGGCIVVPGIAWHLGGDYSQLAQAREAVAFRPPRTRIAHIDTGYDRDHEACPRHILTDLERNFVNGDDQPKSAQDPDFMGILDNSGHGTGTIGILAGGAVAQLGNMVLGGAPEADILPLRISNRVVLFYTSAFAQALQYAIQQRCDVLSMSMGGLPSAAWNETINRAYEAGICMVTAAGNNFSNLPTRHVVYPARYHRVIAAAGAMGNYQPYYNLSVMQGNFGPDKIMSAALAAYTPNIPWPKFGCQHIVDLDGQGTSAATPQIAAAAALWYEKYKSVLPRDWRRVEAVRRALFASSRSADWKYFGQGILQANRALAVTPVLNLPKTPPDNDSFPFFRVLTGIGIVEAPVRERMFNLELMQRWLLNPDLQEMVPDPDAVETLAPSALRPFLEAVIADPQASRELRGHLMNRYRQVFGSSVKGHAAELIAPPRPAFEEKEEFIEPPTPPFRRLRAYAMDPSLATRYATAPISEATLKVRWEKLEPGPKGEYLAVIDEDCVDDQTKKIYPPVDLDKPNLLAQDGYAPSEGNPAFHQQMVYAVVMKTIEHFERALGRPVLWRPFPNPQDEYDDSRFTPRLSIYPHAFHQANAFYSPQDVSLKFGYFEAAAHDTGDHVPGQRVYTCLSHDIVAHETTHAILDGIYSRFNEATNPDCLAFHEAFADIVALMQHFTIQEILENEIRRTRGNLETQSLLGSLAVEFGRATGRRGALREAIGTVDADGRWSRLIPNPADYKTIMPPHSRGALLVAAVFDAFLTIYQNRTADLLRIGTGGTGVLPAGAIHPDLVIRLASEAAKAAGHILNMCIRALDYLPPVDITFYEYLRGIITADVDLVGDDQFNYRVAFIEAFRQRGIYASGLDPTATDSLAVDTLRWRGIDSDTLPKNVAAQFHRIVNYLKRYADACFYVGNRETLFQETWKYKRDLKAIIDKILRTTSTRNAPEFAKLFGLDFNLGVEVHQLRRSIRVGPQGNHIPQVVVALTQAQPISDPAAAEPFMFRGGSTLIVDLSQPAIQYAIFKNIKSVHRKERTRQFTEFARQDPLRELMLMNYREPFAALHAIAEEGN